jgi:hypothetical protein
VNVKGYCPYWTQKQVEQRLVAEGVEREREGEGGALHTVPSFTFVREPLGHFISGLAEAYYRSRHER